MGKARVNGCVGYANYRYFIQFICYTSGMATWVFTTTLAAFIMGNGLVYNLIFKISWQPQQLCHWPVTCIVDNLQRNSHCFDRSVSLNIPDNTPPDTSNWLRIRPRRSGIVMIAIGTFTCSHLWLVTLNRTTIENIQFRAWTNKQSTKKPDTFTHSGKNVFNQGTFKNWTEVMGDKWWQWFCKFYSSFGCWSKENTHHNLCFHLVPVAAKTRCNGVNFGYNSDTLEEYQRVAS